MIKLSVSSIGTYEKCPKNYHYRYIEKPEIESSTWGFLEFGSCAHAVLENFHNYIMENGSSDGYGSIMKRSFESAIKDFDINILREPVWTPEGEKHGVKYLKEIMKDYLSMMIENGHPDVVGVETSFDREIDGYRIRGFIDRIDKVGDGHYRVVDYKTSKSPKYLTPFQLCVYALVIKDMFDDAKLISGSYSLLKHNFKTIDWDFSEDDMQRAREKITTVGGYIESEERWVKKPSTLCNWCDYKSICQPDSWI